MPEMKVPIILPRQRWLWLGKILAFQNDTEFYTRVFGKRTSYQKDIWKDGCGDNNGPVEDSNNFKSIMEDSVFAGSPRVDLLFSYQFWEILAA